MERDDPWMTRIGTTKMTARSRPFLVRTAGADIHEESPRCPYCEKYISDEDKVPARKPWWIIAGTLLVLYIVYRWIAG